MEESKSGRSSKSGRGSSRHEALRSMPVAETNYVEAKAPVWKADHSEDDSRPTSQKGKDTYGLMILGCDAPGISERPLSAASRLGSTYQTLWQEAKNVERTLTTDEHGDITEISEDFQKLRISRNCCQPGKEVDEGTSPEDEIAAATNGLVIQSFSSNTVVVVPETHRSSQSRPPTATSSAGETPVYPVQRSKIQGRRRRVKLSARSSTQKEQSNQDFHQSIQDEGPQNTQNECEPLSARSSTPSDQDFDQPLQDNDQRAEEETGDPQDIHIGSAPPSAISSNFELYELKRPDTTTSEILADGALVSEEEKVLNRLLACFNIDLDEDWYFPFNEDDEKASKIKMLRLVKLFYQRITSSSRDGPSYTYKLAFSGLCNRLEDFVLLATPPGFMIKTRITRVKRGMAGRLYPVYYLHIERQGPGDRKCLILTAKKTSSFRNISYVICTDPAELNEKSVYCVGKLHSNFIGTEFTLCSGRSICSNVPPEKGALSAISIEERFREELATVIYDHNVLGFKGPRKIKVVLPRMKNALEREAVVPRISEESLINQFENDETENIIRLRNKEPIWNRESHSYTLNFKGRVSTASVKNFQIVCSGQETEDQILLQFGRVTENTFSLDFQFPFCPLQAFAIALTSFDSKIACE